MQLTRPIPTKQPKLRIVPLETADRCELPRRKGSAERIHCACGKTFAGGAVVDHPPVIDELSLECTMVRQCYCDHCNHIMVWCESALPDGTPLGQVVSGPGVIKGRKSIERFLRKHPWAAGIL